MSDESRVTDNFAPPSLNARRFTHATTCHADSLGARRAMGCQDGGCHWTCRNGMVELPSVPCTEGSTNDR